MKEERGVDTEKYYSLMEEKLDRLVKLIRDCLDECASMQNEVMGDIDECASMQDEVIGDIDECASMQDEATAIQDWTENE